MNKYLVTWYKGSIETEKTILKQKTVEAENINDVEYLDLLPDNIREKVYYTRGVLFDPEHHIGIDYGSWTEFISIRKVD